MYISLQKMLRGVSPGLWYDLMSNSHCSWRSLASALRKIQKRKCPDSSHSSWTSSAMSSVSFIFIHTACSKHWTRIKAITANKIISTIANKAWLWFYRCSSSIYIQCFSHNVDERYFCFHIDTLNHTTSS